MKAFINKWLLSEQALIAVLVLLMVPLFVLCYYIQPSADDFIYSFWYKAPVPRGFWEYHLGNYMTWNGRYFSTILLTINPLVFGSFTGYKLLPAALILFFYSGLFYFLKNLFNDLNGKTLHIISLLLTITYLNTVPSLPETIYWMAGSITYFLTWGFTFYLFAFFIKYYHLSSFKKKNAFISLVLTFCIIGSNELSAFLVVFLAVIIVIYKRFINKHKDKFSVWFLVISLLLIAVVILSPGNKMRQSLYENHYNITYAIISTFKNTVKTLIIYFKSPAYIVFSLIVFFNASYLIQKSTFLKKILNINLLIIPLITVLIIAFFYFTSAFNMGIEPPLRVHCFIGFFLISSLCLYLIILNNRLQILLLPPLPLKRINIIMSILFISFILTDFHRKAGEDIYIKGNIFLAAYDIRHGAPVYKYENEKRYKLIVEAKKRHQMSLTVPALSEKPKSIFFVDIKPDSTHWINWSLAKYFDINTIKTTE